ncbi:MAG: hypothetical protein M3Z96_11005 [Pseudomonadota bacterium]|nr:hypothetical protein [Pseudomonadota bacterium]
MLPDQSNAPERVPRLFDFRPWRNANSKPSAHMDRAGFGIAAERVDHEIDAAAQREFMLVLPSPHERGRWP